MVQKMLGEQYFNDTFATVNSTKRIINTKTKSILTPRNWKKKTWELTDTEVIQTTLYYVTKSTPQIPSLYETH